MTAVQAEPDGVFAGVAEEAYHADRSSLSVSGAKLLLPPSCPAKFRWSQDHPQKPKRVYDFGHLAHLMVLGEGGEFVILDPAIVGVKKDGTVADSPRSTAGWKKAEAEARAAGATPVGLPEWELAEQMAEQVRNHAEAGPLFERGHAERSMYWTDGDGVRLRGRTDWLTTVDDQLVCVDYKTSVTANPDALVRKFWQLGYFMQAAWYRDLLIALGLSDNPDFLFVVQEKEPPFEVVVVRYDDDAIAEGRRLNRQAIDTYRRCRDSGVWPGYAPDTTVTLSLPGWALREAQDFADQAEAESLINELEGIYQ
ncbi:Exodeoxyribonuclease 8 [Mycolicibacterium vanbaalenii]|uniref:Exodeoxyribonuclease 8 n=1 Tax=Mycolicibacterium vanbaalenii TaxID=110539 RepID=A0A5S9R5K2_MYCVN|nr:PD-(D/E)XK nuclease-like domain-containing protein [Mycolicibacterium vanbaalenii]CAA0129281.1 Exodeoxyribonuclease 8 [Mycolicibacterium vanbaalenii]